MEGKSIHLGMENAFFFFWFCERNKTKTEFTAATTYIFVFSHSSSMRSKESFVWHEIQIIQIFS